MPIINLILTLTLTLSLSKLTYHHPCISSGSCCKLPSGRHRLHDQVVERVWGLWWQRWWNWRAIDVDQWHQHALWYMMHHKKTYCNRYYRRKSLVEQICQPVMEHRSVLSIQDNWSVLYTLILSFVQDIVVAAINILPMIPLYTIAICLIMRHDEIWLSFGFIDKWTVPSSLRRALCFFALVQ